VKKNAAGKYDSKIRKPLKDLTEMQIDRIVDETVKKIVQAKYRQLLAVNKPPKKAGDLFASVENHPFIENADGSCTPIHSVRIWEYTNADKPQQKQITTKGGTRFLSSIGGSNYCSRFYSILDPRGQEIGWRDRVLSRLEAMKLFGKGKSKKKVVLQEIDESTSTAGLGAQEFDENLFVFDLFIHDFILMNNKQQVPTLFRVMSLSSGDIEVRVHTDGRRSDAVKKSGDRVRIGAKSILRRGFRKVFISPAGMLVDAITGEILEKTCFVD
jgi:hypothetical protein